MNNRRSPVPITLCVNQVLQSGKDQLRAQQNSLPSLSQTNSLSQLEIKVMTIKLTLFSYIYNNFSFYTYQLKNCEQKCNTQEQEIRQLKKKAAEQEKELKEHSRKWIALEQQNKPKPAVIPALSQQTAVNKSATSPSSSNADSSQKWLELRQGKLKVDSIPVAIPKQSVSATLATRSSKTSAPGTCTALRMIEGKIRPSGVLPLLFGSVAFSVNQSLTIEGIVIPTQLFSM